MRNNNKRTMKATLEFNFPDDKQEFDLAIKGFDLWSALHDYDQYLRGLIKNPSPDISEETLTAIEVMREKLYEIMNDNNVNLDMVE